MILTKNITINNITFKFIIKEHNRLYICFNNSDYIVNEILNFMLDTDYLQNKDKYFIKESSIIRFFKRGIKLYIEYYDVIINKLKVNK